jgi:hypothetical protein
MHPVVSLFATMLLKTGMALLIMNEVRGLIMTVPILYALYASGGTMMAIWLCVCSLGGVALSVAVPLFVGKKLKLVLAPASPRR